MTGGARAGPRFGTPEDANTRFNVDQSGMLGTMADVVRVPRAHQLDLAGFRAAGQQVQEAFKSAIDAQSGMDAEEYLSLAEAARPRAGRTTMSGFRGR